MPNLCLGDAATLAMDLTSDELPPPRLKPKKLRRLGACVQKSLGQFCFSVLFCVQLAGNQEKVSMQKNHSDLLKVVARGRSGGMVKGFLESVTDLDKFKHTSLKSDEISVCPDDSSPTSVLKIDSLKAIFFVKSFDGNPEYREAQYFTEAPVYQGIWVRVRFFDNEVLEGIMQNGIRPFVEPGLLLTLPDPKSNNEAAYVIKSSLSELQILGVNASY